MKISIFFLQLIIILYLSKNYYYFTKAESCNELVCGSIISKCLLTKSCQCKLSECSCCTDCIYCLGHLFAECCNCLNMCPERNDTIISTILNSEVSSFEGIPELFDTITDSDDEKWQIYQFSINLNQLNNGDSFPLNLLDEIDLYSLTLQQNRLPDVLFNCTVIYLNNCLSNKKCSEYCESMGATSSRWFYDGCCECVGSKCVNYGINENRCARCPDDGIEDDLNLNELYDSLENYDDIDEDEKWDYGEND